VEKFMIFGLGISGIFGGLAAAMPLAAYDCAFPKSV
jgi:ABC-type uncharacterized transport system permease subunit